MIWRKIHGLGKMKSLWGVNNFLILGICENSNDNITPAKTLLELNKLDYLEGIMISSSNTALFENERLLTDKKRMIRKKF